jgi:hypothetical protein
MIGAASLVTANAVPDDAASAARAETTEKEMILCMVSTPVFFARKFERCRETFPLGT